MADIDLDKVKATVETIISTAVLEDLTKKKLRRQVEEKMNLDHKSLDVHKKVMEDWTEAALAVMAEKNTADNSDDNDDDDADDAEYSDVEDSAPAPKKRKATAKAPAAKKAKVEAEKSEPVEAKDKPKFTCTTISGAEAPKQLAKAQASAMKRAAFFKKAGDANVDVMGNKLWAEPREFTSGNLGWYLGGKIEVDIGGEKVWGSCSLNITLTGSKSWT